MKKSTTNLTQHFTGAASLAVVGLKLRELDLLVPVRDLVQIEQKTMKDTPFDKLQDAFISILAGASGRVEINTRLWSDPMLQAAFGRTRCAEQSVVQETLSACTPSNVSQMEQALDQIYRRHSQGYRHDYRRSLQILDVDLTGMPCGPKAALATKGYFAHQHNRRGRQMGRVLATRYDEVVVDRLWRRGEPNWPRRLCRWSRPLNVRWSCLRHNAPGRCCAWTLVGEACRMSTGLFPEAISSWARITRDNELVAWPKRS